MEVRRKSVESAKEVYPVCAGMDRAASLRVAVNTRVLSHPVTGVERYRSKGHGPLITEQFGGRGEFTTKTLRHKD